MPPGVVTRVVEPHRPCSSDARRCPRFPSPPRRMLPSASTSRCCCATGSMGIAVCFASSRRVAPMLIFAPRPGAPYERAAARERGRVALARSGTRRTAAARVRARCARSGRARCPPRRYTLVHAAAETPIDATTALGVLDQLLHSFTLLAGSAEDEYSEAVVSSGELDELMSLPAVRSWLEQVGATVGPPRP